MASRRRTIQKGATYGIGSLVHRPRTVVDIVDGGRTVHWLAENSPPTDIARRPGARTPGKVYACSRVSFVQWLREVEKELEQYYSKD